MALIERDEVARLFRGLVEVLATHDPTRLRTGFEVAELYQEILPYRKFRNQLGFATNQDYESAVLGLLAGLGGFAVVEPSEVQETMAAEVSSPNPDPTLFRSFADARVRLNASRVDQVLVEDTGYAPPPPPPPAETGPRQPDLREPVFELAAEPEATPPGAPPDRPQSACASCGAPLPADRAVVFCPFCGKEVGADACSRCGDELRAGWQFCPRCGHPRPA